MVGGQGKVMPAPKDPEKYKEWIQRLSESHIGKPKSDEWKRKISISNIGKHVYPVWNIGKHLSEETRNKLSESCKGRSSAFKGKYHTLEAKEKLRLAQLGRKHTDETKRKMSLVKMGKHQTEATKQKLREQRLGKPLLKLRGRHHSEETKRKIGFGQMGKRYTEEAKKKISDARARQKFPLKDTTIEIKTRHMLDSMNVSYVPHYMLHDQTFGHHPVDIMVVDGGGNNKYAIETMGCYWHSCSTHYPWSRLHGNITKSVARDSLVDEYCKSVGLPLVRLWEHDINDGVFNLVNKK